ncbi:hypothetical protein [Streptomyces erythrochromogenes]|uniref:hypothetical protein n=1 Tax=Streptomyces erythrochromogenes TaxID=285574 RepID=UPI003678CE70
MTRAGSAGPEGLSVLGLHCLRQTEDNKLLAVVTRRMAPSDAAPDHAATARLTVFIRRNRMAPRFSDPGMVLGETTVALAAGEVAAEVLVEVVPIVENPGGDPRATITAHLTDPRADGAAAGLPPGSGPLSDEEYRQMREGPDTAALRAGEILRRHGPACVVPGVDEMRECIGGPGARGRTYATVCDALRGMLDERGSRAEASKSPWGRPYLPVYPFIQVLAEYGVLEQHGPPSDDASAQRLGGLLRDEHDRLLFAAHFARDDVDFREQHHLDRRLVGGPTRNLVISWD